MIHQFILPTCGFMRSSHFKNGKRAKRRRGAMLPLICLMLVAFMVTVIFSVDVAYMQLVKSELRTATDAAAKAAAEALSRTQDVNAAIARGKAIALENTEDVQLTEDLSLINTAMERMPVAGFTNISGGIDAGGRVMSRGRSLDFVERTMIVLTDGLQNVGRPAALAAAEQAALGTTIHSITFGRDADQRSMQNVANIGRGRFFHANNGAQLRQVFTEIALTLSTIITE